jgi:REP element-mobilizing transposase RayT
MDKHKINIMIIMGAKTSERSFVPMNFKNDIIYRHSIRLKEYDYSQQGMYFITICTCNKKCLFGNIKNEKMKLNNYGRIVETEIKNTLLIRNNIHINSYVIMPNHIHIIIEIECGKARETEKMTIYEKSKMLLPQLIQQFKMVVSKRYREYNMNHPIWQRNYYEHVIRNEKELFMIQEYIKNNPLKWEVDKYYNL